MKVRNGFVSNSSSSSFIIINEDITKEDWVSPDHLSEGSVFESGRRGERFFGWESELHNDWQTKLNFAYMQTQYANDPDQGESWLEMLEEVVKDYLMIESINWAIDLYNYEGNHGYIDHQSSAVEDKNIEMFETKEALKSFIFDHASFIQVDNDNH